VRRKKEAEVAVPAFEVAAAEQKCATPDVAMRQIFV